MEIEVDRVGETFFSHIWQHRKERIDWLSGTALIGVGLVLLRMHGQWSMVNGLTNLKMQNMVAISSPLPYFGKFYGC